MAAPFETVSPQEIDKWDQLKHMLMGPGGTQAGGQAGGQGDAHAQGLSSSQPPPMPVSIMGPTQRGPQGAPTPPGMGQEGQMPGMQGLPGPMAAPPINQQSSGPSMPGLMSMQSHQNQQQKPFEQKKYSQPKMNEYLRGLLYG